jgi:hypothetical protein
MLLRRHGEHAPARVAERIGELALAGDEEGVAMWREIARCVEQLTRAKNTH